MVWQGAEICEEGGGGRTGDSAAKGKKAAATVQWCAAFRKTQAPSANSLIERIPKYKIFLLQILKGARRRSVPILGERFYQMSNAIFYYNVKATG